MGSRKHSYIILVRTPAGKNQWEIHTSPSSDVQIYSNVLSLGGRIENGGKSPCILNIGTSWKWGLLHAQSLYPRRGNKMHFTHSVGGFVASRAGQDKLIEVKICCRYRVSNKPNPSVVPTQTELLFRTLYCTRITEKLLR
jgi:hypothetical protein